MAQPIIQTVQDFVKDLYQKLLMLFQKNQKVYNQIPLEIRARMRTQKLLDYYAGNQLDYLGKLITEQFQGVRFRSELNANPNIRNIVRYLADTVPFTFREGVIINVENQEKQKIINEILDGNRFDNFCRELDKKVYLTKTVFVKVSWRDNEGIVLELITPELVQVTGEAYNPSEIEQIGYPKSLTDRSITDPKGIFCVWNKTNFYYTDEQGTILPNPENPDNVNPYGIIPMVVFRESEPSYGDFWLWAGEELINAQDGLNLKLTLRNYLFKRFNIPLPVAKNVILKNGQNINTDGSEIVLLSSDDMSTKDASFEFLTPETKMEEVMAVINEEIRSILIGQGIDPNLFIQTADRQSGFAIAMMNAKLEERRSISKLSYQYSLEELMDTIAIVWSTHNPDRPLPEETPFIIQIPEPKTYYSSAQDKWMDYQNKLQLNLLTPADILLLERNDLNGRPEANEIINENAKYNRSLKLGGLLMGQSPIQNSTQPKQQ